jgi:hypothetical protein
MPCPSGPPSFVISPLLHLTYVICHFDGKGRSIYESIGLQGTVENTAVGILNTWKLIVE